MHTINVAYIAMTITALCLTSCGFKCFQSISNCRTSIDVEKLRYFCGNYQYMEKTRAEAYESIGIPITSRKAISESGEKILIEEYKTVTNYTSRNKMPEMVFGREKW